MPTTLKIIGTNRLIARLARFPKDIEKASADGISNIIVQIRDDAKALCPVDTGSLKSSIRKQTYAKPAGHILRYGISAGGYVTNPKTGRKVDYASYVEYGTSKMFHKPFMRPAIERHKDKLTKEISKRFKQ